MLYLALHIAGNAAFALLVKMTRAYRFDYPVVGLANYATAAAVSLLALELAGLPSFDARAALFGLVNGVQYQVTYLLMYVLIGMAGIAVTSSFLRLAVAVPVLVSIGLWQEWPRPIQAAGLLLAGVALPLLGSSARRGRSAPAGSEPAVAEVAVPTEPVPLSLFEGRRPHATAEHEAALPAKPVPSPAQETVHTNAPSTHSPTCVALL